MALALTTLLLPTDRNPSVTDEVFEVLYRRIVTLELPPGTRMSEADVARALGVSRQPVRDAFWRLSSRGFLTIRPQRATLVSPVSVAAVQRAQFIRTALEVETMRQACEGLGAEQRAILHEIMAAQRVAVLARDAATFQTLDDRFHAQICMAVGQGHVWDLIAAQKAHMDRVRYLSLSFALEDALEDHGAVLAAIEAREAERGLAVMRLHLGRIGDQLRRIRAAHPAYFVDEEGRTDA